MNAVHARLDDREATVQLHDFLTDGDLLEPLRTPRPRASCIRVVESGGAMFVLLDGERVVPFDQPYAVTVGGRQLHLEPVPAGIAKGPEVEPPPAAAFWPPWTNSNAKAWFKRRVWDLDEVDDVRDIALLTIIVFVLVAVATGFTFTPLHVPGPSDLSLDLSLQRPERSVTISQAWLDEVHGAVDPVAEPVPPAPQPIAEEASSDGSPSTDRVDDQAMEAIVEASGIEQRVARAPDERTRAVATGTLEPTREAVVEGERRTGRTTQTERAARPATTPRVRQPSATRSASSTTREAPIDVTQLQLTNPEIYASVSTAAIRRAKALGDREGCLHVQVAGGRVQATPVRDSAWNAPLSSSARLTPDGWMSVASLFDHATPCGDA